MSTSNAIGDLRETGWQEGPTMFSDEALKKILTEADRIVYDAQELLNKALATGQDELIEAARKNLLLVIENRNRLNHFFALKPVGVRLKS